LCMGTSLSVARMPRFSVVHQFVGAGGKYSAGAYA